MDQLLPYMLENNYPISINTYGLDSSIWSQEILNGSKCESKPANIYNLACSNEGLHDILYPNEVPKLPFSNEPQMSQLPSLFDILTPPLPPYNIDDINNHNSKLNLHQNQINIDNVLGNVDDEAIIQDDLEKNIALIHDYSLLLNSTHHLYKSTKGASFPHDIKNGGLYGQDYVQYVNSNKVTSMATSTIDHLQGCSTQSSFHYSNQHSKQLKRKTQPLEIQPFKKGKLGERFATLHQLVSPFGKMDQASVLMEAMRCIKFLQEKVQALSSPYFKSPNARREDEAQLDLKSKGLCLVPFSCTFQVENANGEDSFYGRVF